MSAQFKLAICGSLLLLAGGCGKSEKQEPSPAAAAATEPTDAIPTPLQLVAGANESIVQVGTHTLTSDALDRTVRQQLDTLGDRIPPDRIDEFKAAAAAQVVKQFVMQTLLSDEAERQGITVTDEDEQRAYDRLKAEASERGQPI